VPESSTATLLVSCPDQRGIVAALAQVLYGHGANILDADQHTDAVAGIFFQRIHFDTSELRTDRTSLEAAIAEVATRLRMTWRLCDSAHRKRVAIFVSRTDHCLYDLLLRHRSGELACDIPVIVSNHEELAPVAAQFGVAYRVIPVKPETKAAAEAAQIALIESERIDLVVLARYMQILSSQFVERFAHRIINIHHSFLPAFSGGRPYQQAHERGVKLIGATSHYVTEALDAGPIIEQDVERVDHSHSPEDFTAVGRDVESVVLARAVRWHVEHRVLLNGRKTVVFR